MLKLDLQATLWSSLAVITCLFTACGGSDQKVSFQSGGMTHTFAEGQGAVPKDFPLPIYPNATTTGSVSAEGDKEVEHSKFLMLSSSDSVEQVSKFYQDELKVTGWKVDSPQESGNLVNISASRGDYEANVMVSNDGTRTTISLALSKGSEAAHEPESNAGDYTPNKLTPPTD